MDQNDKNNKNRRGNRNLLGAVKLVAWALVLTLVFYCTSSYMGSAGKQASNINIKYSDFIAMMESKQVEDVTVDLSEGLLYIVPKDGYVYAAENGTAYTKSTDQDGKAVYAFTDADGKEHTAALKLFTVKMESNDTLVERMHEAGKTDYDTKYEPQMSPLLLFAINFILPFVFIMLMFSLIMRIMSKKGMGGMGGIGGVGKANAKVYMEKQTGVTFADVAGQDEAKESLTEIIDFLHNPKKYTDIGAKLPKGALLVGPPGTGKTLLARACAGEAGVPFYAISGSDFVEMYVGVGASRVRDLFEKAKKTMPSIIFIDEIDAVGRQRGAGLGGGHDEREQTLNQLLVEMDGFDANDGVIVMAATNRADILDKALLRPGRFDRQVYVGLPDVKGREEILRVHTKNKPLGPDVSLKTIAKSTAGFSGADLENLVNEAALLAARKGKKAITEPEIEEASIKVVAGPEKKSRVVTDAEKRLTSYHEAGHAITGYFCKTHDPVHQISIIPRGSAGGFTMYLPEKDPSYVTKTAMNENIVCLLGGRVAEQLVLDDISTGASNDLQRATDTARAMVTRYGFSERMGPVVYGTDPGETFLGRDFGQGKGYSENTASEIDNEIRDIMDESYETARRILTEHMTELHRVAGVLMEREKISGEEFDALMKGENLAPFGLDTPAPAAAPASAEQPAAPEQPSEPSDEN
mgnify:CR=1 FL=1|jgi:cell division protease FtsH